jgi:hypothetical protein
MHYHLSNEPMPEQSNNLLDTFRRYAAIITQTLTAPTDFTPEAETDTAIQVERGDLYAAAVLDPASPPPANHIEKLIELARVPDLLHRVAVIDRTGHHRPVYRPVLIYSALQAYKLYFESLTQAQFGQWEEAMRAWCDLLEAEHGQIDWPEGPMPAARGAAAAEAAWTALALHAAGKLFIRDAWTDIAADTFGRLARGHRSTGALLQTTPSDNPETHWYHELVLLHAAASYAVQTESRHVAGAVQRNTQFHLAETQPDHATAQPWGLFAFIWNPDTRSLADQLLHNATFGHAAGAEGLRAILLADALFCLRLFSPSP